MKTFICQDDISGLCNRRKDDIKGWLFGCVRVRFAKFCRREAFLSLDVGGHIYEATTETLLLWLLLCSRWIKADEFGLNFRQNWITSRSETTTAFLFWCLFTRPKSCRIKSLRWDALKDISWVICSKPCLMELNIFFILVCAIIVIYTMRAILIEPNSWLLHVFG